MAGNMKQALENIQKAIAAPEMKREQLTHFYYTYAIFLLDVKQLPAAKKLLQDLLKEAPDFTSAKKLLEQLPEG